MTALLVARYLEPAGSHRASDGRPTLRACARSV